MAVIGIGIDVGQKRDPTAIAVVEQDPRRPEPHYIVRHLERLPLGTSYPLIATRLQTVITKVNALVVNPQRPYPLAVPDAHVDVHVYVDATGVGQPVCDVLAQSGQRVIPVYFTHGDRRIDERTQITLGKAWLVSRLKTLFQTQRIHLPVTHEALAMKQELLDYEIRVDQDANDRYGAFRVGSHDDLVTAVGLAVGAEAPVQTPVQMGNYAGFGGDEDDEEFGYDSTGRFYDKHGGREQFHRWQRLRGR